MFGVRVERILKISAIIQSNIIYLSCGLKVLYTLIPRREYQVIQKTDGWTVMQMYRRTDRQRKDIIFFSN